MWLMGWMLVGFWGVEGLDMRIFWGFWQKKNIAAGWG
jgi:hypothetical protein